MAKTISSVTIGELADVPRPGNDLQVSIIHLVWQYGPPTMTLAEGDALVQHIYDLIDNYNPLYAAEWFADQGAHVAGAR